MLPPVYLSSYVYAFYIPVFQHLIRVSTIMWAESDSKYSEQSHHPPTGLSYCPS